MPKTCLRLHVHDLNELIAKVAQGSYGCWLCKAERGEPCRIQGTKRKAGRMHADRWNKAERLLRPHTHPGLLLRRPS